MRYLRQWIIRHKVWVILRLGLYLKLFMDLQDQSQCILFFSWGIENARLVCCPMHYFLSCLFISQTIFTKSQDLKHLSEQGVSVLINRGQKADGTLVCAVKQVLVPCLFSFIICRELIVQAVIFGCHINLPVNAPKIKKHKLVKIQSGVCNAIPDLQQHQTYNLRNLFQNM